MGKSDAGAKNEVSQGHHSPTRSDRASEDLALQLLTDTLVERSSGLFFSYGKNLTTRTQPQKD